MSSSVLTPRWYKLKRHAEQTRLMNSPARFKVVPAGRRSGKTERAKRNLLKVAFSQPLEQRWADYRYFAAAPTRDQAKAIYWEDLKAMVPTELLACTPRESDLNIRLKTGAEIWVLGMDKPQRIEGRPWNGGVLDEYANMKPEAWGANVRPALSDRMGWCWLIGVPEGRNHYYDLYKRARADTTGQWDAFTWKSSDILPPEEIEAAKNDLDQLTFEQEYEASFVNFEGRVYYPFTEEQNCARLLYNSGSPLIFCFDFNVAPGVAAVIQEQVLPNGLIGTGIIGEVYIPRNSNTPAVCRKLIEDWGDHKGKIYCYGDATGGAGGTAKVDGSDWELIDRSLSKHFGNRVFMRIGRQNPPQRSRIVSLNSRICTLSGQVKLMVDPRGAPNVVKDFEGAKLLKGGTMEIDKKATPDLTHLTDAIGYYIYEEFPVGTGRQTSVTNL